jgi:hypothetical protein
VLIQRGLRRPPRRASPTATRAQALHCFGHWDRADETAFDLIVAPEHLAESEGFRICVFYLVEAQEEAVGQLGTRRSGEREGIHSDSLHRTTVCRSVHGEAIADP